MGAYQADSEAKVNRFGKSNLFPQRNAFPPYYLNELGTAICGHRPFRDLKDSHFPAFPTHIAFDQVTDANFRGRLSDLAVDFNATGVAQLLRQSPPFDQTCQLQKFVKPHEASLLLALGFGARGCITGQNTHSPKDTAEQMLQELLIAPQVFLMPEGGVEDSSLPVVAAPR